MQTQVGEGKVRCMSHPTAPDILRTLQRQTYQAAVFDTLGVRRG